MDERNKGADKGGVARRGALRGYGGGSRRTGAHSGTRTTPPLRNAQLEAVGGEGEVHLVGHAVLPVHSGALDGDLQVHPHDHHVLIVGPRGVVNVRRGREHAWHMCYDVLE